MGNRIKNLSKFKIKMKIMIQKINKSMRNWKSNYIKSNLKLEFRQFNIVMMRISQCLVNQYPQKR